MDKYSADLVIKMYEKAVAEMSHPVVTLMVGDTPTKFSFRDGCGVRITTPHKTIAVNGLHSAKLDRVIATLTK